MITTVRAQKTTSAAEGTPSLLPTVRLLMEGISRHSVKGDVEELRKFRSQMQHILESLDEDRPHEMYDSVKHAIGLLKAQSHRTTNTLDSKASSCMPSSKCYSTRFETWPLPARR